MHTLWGQWPGCGLGGRGVSDVAEGRLSEVGCLEEASQEAPRDGHRQLLGQDRTHKDLEPGWRPRPEGHTGGALVAAAAQ